MFIRDITPPKISGKKTASLLLPEKPHGKSDYFANLALLGALAFLIFFVITLFRLESSGIKLKQEVQEAAAAGFENLLNGAEAIQDKQFEKAKLLFQKAHTDFEKMEAETGFDMSQSTPLTDPLFDGAKALFLTGIHLSTGGGQFAEIASRLQPLPAEFFRENKTPSLSRPSLTEKLKKEIQAIESVAATLKASHEEIKKIPISLVPRELKDRFSFAKDALAVLADGAYRLKNDIPAILTLLGDKLPHTFLVLLQNNAELRPSGGFIGNYMILETNDGYLTKNDVFDVYSADHQLTENIPPPPEIAALTTRWFMRDSNYSGHFPLSAKKAAWFLEKENGPGVDTVIAIDQNFVKELLRLTGPISLPELAAPLSAENFGTVLSFIIESKLSGREDPKAILRDFLPAIENKIFSAPDPTKLLALFKLTAESKHLLAYSSDTDIQAFFGRSGLAGEMKTMEPKEDYLAIVHTSIGGNKSDTYMAETIAHDTFLGADGGLTDEVTIVRRHEWNSATERRLHALLASFGFREISDKVMRILGGSRNLHMLRVYVPKGSVLVESSNPAVTTRLDEETGKTYFSARMEVPVGTAKSLKIRYRLPFALRINPVDNYRLTIQKQAGQENIMLKKRIFPAAGVRNYEYFPKEGNFDLDGVWSFESALEKDTSITGVWGK